MRAHRHTTHRASLLGALAAVILLAGCAGSSEEEYVERPAEALYADAKAMLDDKGYDEAATAFDEVERQHPYSIWATRAQLMAAYANYENSMYDEAIVALERFLRLHPSHKDAPYARYLLALSYYEQISDVKRDQRMTELAQKNLRELVKRHPDSKYGKDAKLKLDLTRDHLAGKEMEIGRYYLRWRQYVAAINRFKVVIDNFETTTHVPEALHRLVECYLALGMVDEAKKTAAVLGYNYPGSEWYIDGYELVTEKRFRTIDDTPWYKFW